jgi:hypothetical protein
MNRQISVWSCQTLKKMSGEGEAFIFRLLWTLTVRHDGCAYDPVIPVSQFVFPYH